MFESAAELVKDWRSRLACDYPQQSAMARESILQWLIGNDPDRLEQLKANDLAIAQQAMVYRNRILQQRYLGTSPQQAYRRLIARFSSLVPLRDKIRTLVSLSRDRQRDVVDVLQEVLQELLQSDRYMQQQMAWIARCTGDHKLRNAMLFASLEDYCLRPIRHQPLLIYRFVNYLRRSCRGGLTHVPTSNRIRLVSEDLLTDDDDNRLSLLDAQAVNAHQNAQEIEEQQALRQAVQQQFAGYLAEKVGANAAHWLHLYLQGHSQEAIASALKLSVKDVYRLREKVSYHAMRVFALKQQSELVSNWLETSLLENNFGLSPRQWQQFWDRLTPQQRQLIELKKAGKEREFIIQSLRIKNNQFVTESSKLYLIAQGIRNQE